MADAETPQDYPKHRIGEGQCYRLLRLLSRVAVWSYFRRVTVISHETIPKQGPLLVAANHTNMVLDPAMLIATFPHYRPCHFWALARFFKIPVVGKLLLAGGVLPVDTKTHSNAKLFEHTLDCLGKGGVIALFPEGTSYTAPMHLPFKDGISWATFEYLTQQQSLNKQPLQLSIVPVGITYTTKNRWRSDVIIEYGNPIMVEAKDLDEFEKDPKTSVKDLTHRIALGVEKGTINAPDWETSNAATEARWILFGDANGIRLRDYVRISQSLIELFSPAALDDQLDPAPVLRDERQVLKNQLLICAKQLQRMKLTALDIRSYEKNQISQSQAFVRLLSTTAALVVQLPLFLPGLIINSPLYLLGRFVNRWEVYTESVAQDKVVFALTLAVPIYGYLFYVLWRSYAFSLIGWALATCLVPLFAWYHIRFVDKRYDLAKQVAASWRIFVAVTGLDQDRKDLQDMVKLRRWCYDQLQSIVSQLDQAGDPHARTIVECAQEKE
ncbi:hypothetical protein DM01DRAFT_1325635 [Hesseltinella vesiculosa]|uniref:Phospholipid/glycerol acyltransferase domain-containing protein n=1 Tax=Hesseltinella vesiculosa TaxID=101127 RepID=A0A1X2GAV6_9FUNG|nr:hypothetical protein DM01DRAFT_1325635 [Hesseltinella vesiculosa]